MVFFFPVAKNFIRLFGVIIDCSVETENDVSIEFVCMSERINLINYYLTDLNKSYIKRLENILESKVNKELLVLRDIKKA